MTGWVKGLSALCCASLLTACGQDSGETAADGLEQAPTAQAPVSTLPTSAPLPRAPSCDPEGVITYLCGLLNAEDLLEVGDSGLILASGMSSGNVSGHLYLIDPQDNSWSELIFGGNFSATLDAQAYPNCPGLINLGNFSMHGLALREIEGQAGRFDLYVTSHGAREAIEIFELDMSSGLPALSWQGCVPLPDNTFANSVAILSDGGFVTTKMMDPAEGFAPIGRGEITGLIYEWHPGGEVTPIEGTELSGPNGIAVSPDDRFLYVTVMGAHEVRRFDRSTTPISSEAVPVGIVPDNIRWDGDSRLITAGSNFSNPSACPGSTCPSTGWSIWEVNAETLQTRRAANFEQPTVIQGISTALHVGNEYWVGTFNGSRVARIPD